jgi:dolichol-phosphate mannosyltransferase
MDDVMDLPAPAAQLAAMTPPTPPRAADGAPSDAVSRPAAMPAPPPVVELTVVVPTFNERGNVARVVETVERALSGIRWEIVFVDDDSRDGTVAEIRRLAARDRRVRCIHRLGRRGLSSACIEGIQSSCAPYVAVMDADLQHDERLLAQMLRVLKDECPPGEGDGSGGDGPVDLVVGSRYVAGGGTPGWAQSRVRISGLATHLGRMLSKADIADPMSGFFMLRRETFDLIGRRLSGIGFKILLDILLSSPRKLNVRELPYEFRPRQEGDSKLDAAVAIEYLLLLCDKLIGNVLPTRFVLFSLVGGLGVVVHLLVLAAGLRLLSLAFPAAQALATVLAMVGNFYLNNMLTYRDRRLRGRKLLTGLLSFCAVCGVGTVANVQIASALFASHWPWWLAGIAGAAVSAVWNYSATALFTWRRAH